MRHLHRWISLSKALSQQGEWRPEIGDRGEAPGDSAEPVQNFLRRLSEQKVGGAGRQRAGTALALQIAIEDQDIIGHRSLLAHHFAANPANFLAPSRTSFILAR